MVAGSDLRPGLFSQGPSLFLSSPFVACDTEAKSSLPFASVFTKAAEHPSTQWVTPVGMSYFQEATISATLPARPCALGSQNTGVQGSFPDTGLELLEFAVVVE